MHLRLGSVLVATLLAGSVHAAGLTSLAELRRPTAHKETFVYKKVEGRDLTLDVYPPGKFPEKPQPAIVFFHGGGFSAGTTDLFAAHCRYFASRGLVAVNVSYRLTKGVFPDLPGGTLFDCIADAQDAVAWVRAQAGRLGIDPQRIVAAGDSAGGHLAASTGLLPDPRPGRSPEGAKGVPNAMVLYNPPLDLDALPNMRETPGLRGLPADRQQSEARRASPMLHIRRGAPPTLLLHGALDTGIPEEQARRFQRLMIEAGNRCDLTVYPGVSHAFVLLDYYPEEDVVVRAIRDTDRFLESLGYLKGPPTLASLEREAPPIPKPVERKQ